MMWMTGHLTRRSALLSFPVFSAFSSVPHFDCWVAAAAAASCLKHFSVLCLSRRFPPHTTHSPRSCLSHQPRHESFSEHFFVFALDFSVIYVSMPSGMLACLSVSLSDLPTFTYDSCMHTLHSLSGHLTLSRCMQRTHSSGLVSFFLEYHKS